MMEHGGVDTTEVNRREFFTSVFSAKERVESDDILLIDTPDANYFPIYEAHPNPASYEELKKLPKQDIFLYEWGKSSEFFTDPKISLETILKTEIPTKGGSIIPGEQLKYLMENNTKIIFEGCALSLEDERASFNGMASEFFIGSTVSPLALSKDTSKRKCVRANNVESAGVIESRSPREFNSVFS